MTPSGFPRPLSTRDVPTQHVPDGDEMTGLDKPDARSDGLFTVVAFTSVALYNVVELTAIILTAFKKRSGLYFTSFCVATWGILPYSIAFLVIGVHQPEGPAIYGYVTMIVVGWVCTVSGQSVVLYSRLHLIDRDRRHLRFVLAMIVTNGVVLHSVTTVMVFGANSLEDPSRFYVAYSIVEKIQVTVFFIQELAISLLYIYSTVAFFRHSTRHAESTRTRMLRNLVIVNAVVILLDITILTLEFADLHELQTGYKAMAYSIKLKLEFSILTGLAGLTRDRPARPLESAGWDIFDGGRGASRTLTTISAGRASYSRGSEKRRGSLASGHRGMRESLTTVPEGVIVRTTDTSVIRHRASESPVKSPAKAAIQIDV